VAILLVAPPAGAVTGTSEPEDDDAVVVINGDVAVEQGETVDGVFIASGDARIDGTVDGDVVLAAGDVLVSGRVDGNIVTFSGRTRLLPSASVDGDLIYTDERPRVAPAATVDGDIEDLDWADLDLFPFIGAIVLWLAVTFSMAILGILLLLIAPRAADAAFRQAETRFWTAVGIGAAIFIVLPVASFVAAITLFGLPLALALGLALLPLAAVAYVTAAWALGRAIVKPPRERILAFLAGLAILRAVALIPVLGILVWIGAVIVGLGLLGGAIAAAREPTAARAPDS
jgi:hypothetical protein